MTVSVDQCKDKVNKSISPKVLKQAASNWDCGAPVIKKLLGTYQDAVRQNIDINVIHATVLNGGSGQKILEERVKELSSRIVYHEMPDWLKEDCNSLETMLKNIKCPTDVASNV
ncbi:MAG: hypothetical protein HETSPECPRED_002858 [Heterodermia speciosa]|uniref:Uncharacterized protein n=1 Tax=Heterodermia speciosa TaxID=116794 RepID=A0A8H3PGY7_9LECA|nr:MAG: hypothetical protein HETSPECPRED_002858 [Heterodermia speciosa]